jgi:hypothetical protein
MRIWILCMCGVLGAIAANAQTAEQVPMESSSFEAEIRKLDGEQVGAERLRRAKELVLRRHYSSRQVKAIAMRLPDDDARLEFATEAFPRTVDPENFYDVYDSFTSFSKVFRLHDRVRSFPGGTPVMLRPEPMSQHDFGPILKALKNESFDPQRLQLARQIFASSRRNFLSAQVRDMAKTFGFESGRLDFAKLAYDYTIDPEKYFLVNEAFSFANTRDQLSRYVAGKVRPPQKAEAEE